MAGKDGSLRVSVSSHHQWRKGSVTIIEGQEPGDEEELHQEHVEAEPESVLSSEKQLLAIPSNSLTNSSSAETLTDNTLTGSSGPNTPTIITK